LESICRRPTSGTGRASSNYYSPVVVSAHHAPVAAHHSGAIHSWAVVAHHSRAIAVSGTIILSGLRPIVAAGPAGQTVAVRRESPAERCPWPSARRIDVALATSKPSALGVDRQRLYGPRGEEVCHCNNPHYECQPRGAGRNVRAKFFSITNYSPF